MADDNKPIYRQISPSFSQNWASDSNRPLASNTDNPYTGARDRRKADRRRGRPSQRGPFDMRSGRGRRKDDFLAPLEVKA